MMSSRAAALSQTSFKAVAWATLHLPYVDVKTYADSQTLSQLQEIAHKVLSLPWLPC